MSIYADWINAQSGFIGRKLTVALSTIGSFSYYSNARVIDLVGLTDRYIAHHPMQAEGIDEELPLIWKERHYNAEYILSSKPDYIIFPAGAKPSAFAECAVFINPEFKRHYFTQIFYSEKLHQLLPIFTRIHGNLTVNADPDRSDPKFVRHYIEADNLFLKMIKTGNVSLLNRILSECDSITFYCPARESEALTIKGFALYHAGIFEEAENFLVQASESDLSNSIARFYLKNIYFRDGRVADGIRIMREIKRFSPDALLEYKDGELN
jgi:tetratricopeptide (TPR) repeat protein